MIFRTIVSGSSGNSIYIRHKNSRILVDAGLSFRALKRELLSLEEEPRDITAIFLTHEHNDHIRGIYQLAQRVSCPIYGRRETLCAILEKSSDFMPDRFTAFAGEGPFAIGDFAVTPFDTPHDVPSLGYKLEADNGRTVSIATDLGHVDETIFETIADSDFTYIESNHDVDMLSRGDYPYALKKRILSNNGHLSNAACAEAVARLVKEGCRHFVLGHLSSNNNLPSLALGEVCGRLTREGVSPGEVTVDVAPRLSMSRAFEL